MTNETATDEKQGGEASVDQALLEVMAKAGVWYGRRKSKTDPRMREFIYGTRNGIEIFDLPHTLRCLESAGNFLQSTMKDGGRLLFVGTTPAAQEFVRNLAEKFDFPYVVERWLGGTLTNFKTLRERIKYFLKLKKDRDEGKLEKYTKKEQTEFTKKIERLTRLFGGLEKLEELPSALFVVGANAHIIALREAKRLNIPVVAIANSDANPEMVAHMIPANDNTRSSIGWILEKLSSYLEEGKKERERAAKEETEKKETEKVSVEDSPKPTS